MENIVPLVLIVATMGILIYEVIRRIRLHRSMKRYTNTLQPLERRVFELEEKSRSNVTWTGVAVAALIALFVYVAHKSGEKRSEWAREYTQQQTNGGQP